ncbi:hypothetical protein IOD16_24690 [Saccharothrix sp. 6-C]|uniref:effector-associated domain 2-containing protein n=1 Tax=Saccharothrix sp. 6-C TaxID=2781735 RepID=UPI0019172517|nr:hypothetical protein [Saccharothrix sp. 6-C]QQQ74369.1 hypothetical protein IOD16_24690 [Saccharothrix sp. 6-C]
MAPGHAVVAIATDAAADLDRGRRLLAAVLDGPARAAPGHHDVLFTRPPSARFAVRLTEAVHRHNDSSASPLRLRLAMAHGEVSTALAVLGSAALRSAHAATTRPVTIAVTDGYARARPLTDHDRHRLVRVPDVPEPVWLLDARVPDAEALFHALMALPSMRREDSRRLVLDLLPPAITALVPHHPTDALHVSGLLLACLEHEGGLNALRHALHVVEGEDSTPMARIDTLLRNE